MKGRRAVFLDRDGVINETVFRRGKLRAPYSVEELKLLPGVEKAVALLKEAGFLCIIASNQPDVARGWVPMSHVLEVNNSINQSLAVHEIKCCFHVDIDNCECRKPRPGMLLEAAKDWSLDLKDSYMVGDRLSDIEAGHKAGCHTILITGNPEGELTKDSIQPDAIFASLKEATDWILSHG